jgi:hypothetical protein
MFRIERTVKLLMLARKKSSRYTSIKFTLIVEDYAASEKWQKIFICILIIALFLSSGRVLG